MLRRILPVSLLLLGLYGCVQGVNETIRVEAGQTTGDQSTVNGSVHLGRGAHAGALGTVNGSIVLGEGASADEAETVNGSIRLAADARLARGADTVNGGISLERGAVIGGDAGNVNGDIRLEAARVGGTIETVNGDILVGADSTVDGGIHVRKPGGGWLNFGTSSGKPRITIGPRAVVGGPLRFDREVELRVSDRARIGNVTGATPTMYSGDEPPGS